LRETLRRVCRLRRFAEAEALVAADSPVGVHEREDGEALHTIRKVFGRALDRAKIAGGDVTVHTLRHTALSCMIERVGRLQGDGRFPSTRRRACSSATRIRRSNDASWRSTRSICPRFCPQNAVQRKRGSRSCLFARKSGGRQEARTPDLRVANAALARDFLRHVAGFAARCSTGVTKRYRAARRRGAAGASAALAGVAFAA
jgi:hypothetical protein